MAVAKQDQLRDLALRLAGAWQSRRIYAAGSPIWQKTLESLKADVDAYFQASESEVFTFALLGEGIAVSGVPIVNGRATVGRLAAQLKVRDIEIISLQRQVSSSELETLLAFLSAEAAEVSAVKAGQWLKERGVDHIEIKHLKLMAGAGGIDSFRDVFRGGAQNLNREIRAA